MPESAPTTGQIVAAEVLGTFVLVFFGCGSVVYAGETGAASTVTTIGLTFGVAVMVMVYAVGRISGGHFNPAVSVGAAMGGRMAWSQVPLYVAAQLGGAILAAAALFGLMHGFDGFAAEGNLGQNSFGDEGSGYALWAALLLELLLTAVFVFVILAVTDARNEHPALAPLAIGLTLAAIHFVAIPATGTSVNPARSIGPALFAGTDAVVQLWVFVLAPLIGGAIAGLGYPALFGQGGEAVAGSGLGRGRPEPAAVPGYGAPDQYQQQWNQESYEQQWQAQQAQAWQGSQWPAQEPVQQEWTPEQQAAWEAQQWTPEQIAAWEAQQAQQAQQQAQQQWPQPPEPEWPPAEGEPDRTQIRRPDGQ